MQDVLGESKEISTYCPISLIAGNRCYEGLMTQVGPNDAELIVLNELSEPTEECAQFKSNLKVGQRAYLRLNNADQDLSLSCRVAAVLLDEELMSAFTTLRFGSDKLDEIERFRNFANRLW